MCAINTSLLSHQPRINANQRCATHMEIKTTMTSAAIQYSKSAKAFAPVRPRLAAHTAPHFRDQTHSV